MSYSGKICYFYLQGNCRYGENCWNQHPRHLQGSSQPPPSSGAPGDLLFSAATNQRGYPSRSGLGSSRRVGWGGHNQRSIVVQASSFPKSSNWHSNRDHGKTYHGPQADAGFSQNRFAALNNNENSGGIKNEEEMLLEIIMKDMEIWESSGQWMFSSYSPSKDNHNISGFLAFSPEELRLEYYNCRANNNIQNYINTVQQLVTQWRSRLLELKNINTSTKTALLAELKNVANQPQPAFGFGGQQSSAFGTSNFPGDKQSSAKTFSFKSPSELAISSGSLPAFGSLTSVQKHTTLGATSSSTNATTTHPVGFGYQTAPLAASFSFKSTTVSGGFGTSGSSGFGQSFPTNSSNNASGPVFGIGSTAVPAPPLDSRSASLFGPPATAFGSSGTSVSSVTQSNIASEKLFTPKTELSTDELKQFEAKKFTLGKIPLKPPPLELISV